MSSRLTAFKFDITALLKPGENELVVTVHGEIFLAYSFQAIERVNPRQWGFIWNTSRLCRLYWRRESQWSVYPNDHISRPVGEASLFYPEVPQGGNPRTKPLWSWSKDCNELGSNDFRSTRRNIWFAGLKTLEWSESNCCVKWKTTLAFLVGKGWNPFPYGRFCNCRRWTVFGRLLRSFSKAFENKRYGKWYNSFTDRIKEMLKIAILVTISMPKTSLKK